jgi:cytochrome c553
MTPARLVLVGIVFALPAEARAADGVEFFEKKVRPVLVEHCYACHSAEAKKTKGGLRLDTTEAILKGGDSGPLVKAGEEDSLLLKAVGYREDGVAMPPKGKLPDAVIADLRTWVKGGAQLPTAKATTGATAVRDVAKARDFWSFRPLKEHPAPPSADRDWPRRKIDFFVHAKLAELKLTPAAAADRRTLIRRAYFDLIGLPPAFEQVEAFAADTSPGAFEKLVDDLLASPRFGEKWGRHWLDVARYAEDNSTGESTCKPARFPYRYRDWVIAAFNADLPFDDFVRRQLAADLLPSLPPSEVAALGFLGLSPAYHKEPKLSKDVIAGIVADEWDERVDTVTRGFLGLTVACARCHDHKFDPISTEDYYALAGVMANTQLAERPLVADDGTIAERLTTVRLQIVDATQRLSYARDMRSTAVKEKRDPRPFDKPIKDFEAVLNGWKAKEKALFTGPIAPAVRDAATSVNGTDPDWTTIDFDPTKASDLPVFVRGNPAKAGPIVPRRFPLVLSAAGRKPFAEGSGRRELAECLVTDAKALTARVFVNRAWGWVFGQPLVTTPSNFGALGDRPSHPELLDDLAARFVARGWSVKWLVREMVLSATYQQSATATAVASDPDNRWLWRANRKRLEAEGWRDAVLSASGTLDLNGGGPSEDLDRPSSVRRTVYGVVSRQRLPDVFRLFDLPDPKFHGEKRDHTTTPVQQLYFLNSPFVRQSADAVVAKAGTTGSPPDVAKALFRRVLLRDPTTAEVETALKLVRAESAKPEWALLAQALLASNEFLFLN